MWTEDARGQRVTYGYHPNSGRVARIAWGNGSDFNFQYGSTLADREKNRVGRAWYTTHQGGHDEKEYDALGNVKVWHRYKDGQAEPVMTLRFAYDALGRVKLQMRIRPTNRVPDNPQ